MKDFVYLKDVVSLSYDPTLCNACGMCVKVCPRAVFTISENKASLVNRDNCMDCGACALNCSTMAISVQSGQGCGCATGVIESYFNGGESECCCSKGN